MTSSLNAQQNVNQAVTDRIIEAIEAGAGEFVMPWHRVSAGIGRPTNVAPLWAEGSLSRFTSGFCGTYQQWQALGAQVSRGEHSATIVFYKPLKETNAFP